MIGRKKKKMNSTLSRTQRVFEAVSQNVCVDCGQPLKHGIIFDGHAEGFYCPFCKWECQIGDSNH